jgi:hypothetical protein
MNKPEVIINIEDIYYKHDQEDRMGKNLLERNKNNKLCCFYSFLERFFCCFL